MKILRSLARFRRDREGSVLVIFALASVVLLTAVALLVTYSEIAQVKGRLGAAADAAVLAAVSRPAIDATLSDAGQIDASKKIATDWFRSRVPSTVTLKDLTVTVTKVGTTLTAKLDYSVVMQTSFAQLLAPEVTLGGTSSSTFTSAYMDIIVLVDTSQSMGLGADLATQTKMIADPKVNWCALACHGNPGGTDTVVAAHSAGYKLRIDVVKDALATVIADAEATAKQTRATIRIGIYAIDTKFRAVSALTSDFAALKTAAATLDIAHYDAGSSLYYGLGQIKSVIGTPGNGTSASSPLTFVMFLSDGLANAVDNQSTGWWVGASTAYPAFSGKSCWTQSPPPDTGPWYAPTGEPAALPCVPDPWTSTHGGNGQMEMAPLDPAWCQPIKATGARMMTLYAEYVLLPDASTSSSNPATNDWRLPLIKTKIQPKLQPAMAACASRSGDAFVGADTAGINAGVKAMFSAALASISRLTR